jgi:hypothetical protein
VGDCSAERGLQESREILASTEGRQYRSVGAAVGGLFAALLGRQRDSAQAWALADRLAREVPSSLAAVGVAFHRADAMLAIGNWASAAHLMTRVSAQFAESESWSMLSTVAARRAIALLHMREVDAARAEVTRALQHAAEVDVATHAPARAVESWLAAIDGEKSLARHHAAEATLLLPDEALLDRALVHAACAGAMLALGDRDEADRHQRAVIELYERKGNVAGVAHHRGRLSKAGG